MRKRLLPTILFILGLLFAGGVGYLYKIGLLTDPSFQQLTSTEPQDDTASNQEATETEASEEAASTEDSSQQEQDISNLNASDESASANPDETKAGEENVAASEITMPELKLMRVEPDGSSVIGGTSFPNQLVELYDGETKIAEVTAGVGGDFVFVLDAPLSTGMHQLTLKAVNAAGETIVSAASGLVNIPLPGKEDELAVLIEKPGEATQFLVTPGNQDIMAQLKAGAADIAGDAATVAGEEVAEAAGKIGDALTAAGEAVAESAVESGVAGDALTAAGEAVAESAVESGVAGDALTAAGEAVAESAVESGVAGDALTAAGEAIAESAGETGDNAVETAEAKETAETALADPASQADTATPGDMKPVLLQAADVEGGKIFIAGTGEPGMQVNIYLSEKLLGSTQVGEKGAFLFEDELQLAAGRHAIRADMIKPGSDQVLARAAVELLHEPVVADASQAEAGDSGNASAGSTNVESANGGDGDTPATQQDQNQEQSASASSSNETTTAQENESSTASSDAESGNTTVAASQQPSTTSENTDGSVNEEVADNSDDASSQNGNDVLRTGSSVIIRRGDSLWRVARRNYGQGIRYTTIFEANRDQIRDPDLIYPGQVFEMPEN